MAFFLDPVDYTRLAQAGHVFFALLLLSENGILLRGGRLMKAVCERLFFLSEYTDAIVRLKGKGMDVFGIASALLGMIVVLGMYALIAGIVAYIAYWVIRKGVKAGIMDARAQERAADPTGEDT